MNQKLFLQNKSINRLKNLKIKSKKNILLIILFLLLTSCGSKVVINNNCNITPNEQKKNQIFSMTKNYLNVLLKILTMMISTLIKKLIYKH